ncbi:hypothetical protein EB796_013541 [Bugula neritina]|uniref:Fibronectin type-III domain-containing protein n=1 Tax=Bugula neritina TaxID=10212 RepID=A0A7J7JQJ8_BUGNE|nr:hypothetical protein EB796_013541 [Bugula neritina]
MRCVSSNWVEIPSNNKSCGYSPYQLVSCDIRATRVSNSAGTQYSNISSAASVRTQCAAPSLPSDLSSYIRQYNYTPVGESKAKVRIYLNLLISDIVANCRSISSIKYKLKEDREYIRNTQYITNLLPFTNYTIGVKVTNNVNNQTTASFTFRTMTLEPYDAPVIVRSAPYNTTCVYLEWKEPNQPNGVITKYRIPFSAR